MMMIMIMFQLCLYLFFISVEIKKDMAAVKSNCVILHNWTISSESFL